MIDTIAVFASGMLVGWALKRLVEIKNGNKCKCGRTCNCREDGPDNKLWQGEREIDEREQLDGHGFKFR